MTGWMQYFHVWAGLACLMMAVIIVGSVWVPKFKIFMAANPIEHELNANLTALFFFTLSLDLIIVALTVDYWLHLGAIFAAGFFGYVASWAMLGKAIYRWIR